MKKQEVLNRFTMRTLAPTQLEIKHLSLKQSAVLVPLIERNNQIFVILTKRAAHLRHHPGQISFPGGKADSIDRDLEATALRETHEELGIDANQVNIFGELPFHDTITGFRIKPYIGFVQDNVVMNANAGEVSEVIEIPLVDFIKNRHHFMIPVIRPQISVNVYFKPTAGHAIWGATAAILEQLQLSLH